MVVIRCEAGRNFAIGSVPWGPMAAIPTGLDPVEYVLTPTDSVDPSVVANASQVLVVTSDRHRYPWMSTLVDSVRQQREDAVLIEMGTTGVAGVPAPAIASFGSGLANTRAVVDLLTGKMRR